MTPEPPADDRPREDPAARDVSRERLLDARRELVGTSGRTRLLNTALERPTGTSVRVVDERADAVFDLLVRRGVALRFGAAEPAPDPPAPETTETTETTETPETTSTATDRDGDAASATDDTGTTAGAVPEGTSPKPAPPDHGPPADEAKGPAGPPSTAPSGAAADGSEADGASTDGTSTDGTSTDRTGPGEAGETGTGEREDEPTGDGSPETDAPAARHTDRTLQTTLDADRLLRVLRRVAYEARSGLEEQGVNLLHLALGFLEWREADSGTVRFAPLVLVPVEIERRGVGRAFRISHSGAELATNLSLQARLRADFGIDLPELVAAGTDDEELVPSAYMDAVRAAVAEQPGWVVHEDAILLGFFSFASFLIYRDLDPEVWPPERPIEAHPMVAGLLAGRFPAQPPPICGDDDPIDDLLPPHTCLHVMDADSSQSVAIADVVTQRRSLVLQGPPGTGKSQTIANLVAAAVAAGRRVLFLAEKQAALEVVRRRLERIGLGAVCLELHSTKAKRTAVLAELERTLHLGRPRPVDAATVRERLAASHTALQDHVRRLSATDPATGFSVARVLGELARLQATGRTWTPLELDGAETWSAGTLESALESAEDVGRTAAALHPIDTHPWRGVTRDDFLPSDRQALPGRLDRAVEAVERAVARRHELEAWRLVDAPGPDGLDALDQSVDMLEHLAAAPPGMPSLPPVAWREHDALRCAVDAADRIQRHRAVLGDALAPGLLDAPLDQAPSAAALRHAIASRRRSLLRWITPAWYRARRELAALFRSPPAAFDEQLRLLDELVGLQCARTGLAAVEPLAAEVFGSAWRGAASNLDLLSAQTAWIGTARDAGMPDSILAALDHADAARTVDRAAVRRDVEEARAATVELGAHLAVDWSEAFGTPDAADSIGALPLDALLDRVRAWAADPVRLEEWTGWTRRRAAARGLGLGAVVTALERGELSPESCVDQVDMAFHEGLLRRLDPDHTLLRFDVEAHESNRRRFVELDRRNIALNRVEVAARHHAGLPAADGSVGEIGLLQREIRKRSRHLSIRRLLDECGETIQRLKPVIMMSPHSVAQYLTPGRLEFDLLLVDEASQVRPVEALGAIARLAPDGQAVVVGDERQLPPTRFFRSVLVDDEEVDAADGGAVGDLESILGVCVASGMPARMLRWHYRSRHHSLIALSNRHFYEGRLQIVPSPAELDPQLGLRFHAVPRGDFRRGSGAVNPAEAEAVARAVIEHARTEPELTLGVGAFSIRQRNAILEALEAERAAAPELEEFFSEDGSEPFFVKNLENIQGDERDVILISVGYGPDADGRMTMNFGPVSQEGGERRLNVLITRARMRCAVFSSMTDEDIDLSRATGRGPAALKAFLRYCRTGLLEGGTAAAEPAGDASRFGRAVASRLRATGLATTEQVGVAGCFVDVAVRRDADAAGADLGIDCDAGDALHARWARDRERTRPAVLRARGWNLVHLWSPAWIADPEHGVESVVDALRRASHADDPDSPPPGGGASATGVERDAPEAPAASTPITVPYAEATIDVPRGVRLQDMDPNELRDAVVEVVRQEGPVHEDEVVRRMTTLWGLSRAGGRAADAVRAAMEVAVRLGVIVAREAFVDLAPEARADESPRVPRRRTRETRTTLRRADRIPPSEARELLRRIVERYRGATEEESILEARRQLGFRSTSPALRELLTGELDELRSAGVIEERRGRLVVTEPEGPGIISSTPTPPTSPGA